MATSKIKKSPKEPMVLWRGTWDLSGSLTINRLSEYRLFIITGDGWPLLGVINGGGNVLAASVIGADGTDQYVRAIRINVNGNTISVTQNTNIRHRVSDVHGAAGTVGTITEIYGII